MLSIKSNISALASHQDLKTTTNAVSKSLNRLSSGLRINSAADDPSGISISERMRTQIKGLSKAEENSQNGLSMLQTAEGALGEMHDMINRMRELAVQASNGTLTSLDRLEIQREVDQLLDETDSISTRTEFNTKKLLNGDSAALWSSSETDIEAVIRGDVTEGSYELEIESSSGVSQVQQTSIFRIKEGVNGVRELNYKGETAKSNPIWLSANPGNIAIDFTLGDDTVNFNLSTTGTDRESNAAQLVHAINSDHHLNNHIVANYDPAGSVIIEAREAGLFGNGYQFSPSGSGLDPNSVHNNTLFEGSNSETGISGVANVHDLLPSLDPSINYTVTIDEGADGQLQTGAEDIYGLVGSYLQEGSSGVNTARMAGDLTTTAINGALHLNFDFGHEIVDFTATTTMGTIIDNATEVTDAINNDNRLNSYLRAIHDGTGDISIEVIDTTHSLDYRLTAATDPTIDVTDQGLHHFSGGTGFLGTDRGDMFTLNSNSATGGYGIIEFTSDGRAGASGLHAKVSFDQGETWRGVMNLWNGVTDVLVEEGDYSLEFNALFDNHGVEASFQKGDKLLIAMNDNDFITPTSHTIDIDAPLGGNSTVDLDITLNDELFTIPGTILTGGDPTLSGNDLLTALMDPLVIGSNGTVLNTVLTTTTDGSGQVTLQSDYRFDLNVIENGINDNLASDQEGVFTGFSQIRDHTRVNSFNPRNDLPQQGAVFSYSNGILDRNTNRFETGWIDTNSGNIGFGGVDISFHDETTGKELSDGEISFNIVHGGGDVSGETQLIDIDRFYDADNNFILGEHGEYLTIYNGVGDHTEIFLDGGDTLNELSRKIQEAIIKDVPEGGLGFSSGDVSIDQHIVDFIESPISQTIESDQGSIVIRSPLSDREGRFFFAGSEDLVNALGLSISREAENNELSVIVRDALTQKVIGNDLVTDNTLTGVIDGVDVHFKSNFDLDIRWNKVTRNYNFSSKSEQLIETLTIVDNNIDLQIGANENQRMSVFAGQMDTESLGINHIVMTHFEGAQESIALLDHALDMVSQERSRLGAYMNRLDHTMNNLSTQRENTVASESRIRDLDIAKESTELTKQQMLAQSATTMLAQANQKNQGLLGLFQ